MSISHKLNKTKIKYFQIATCTIVVILVFLIPDLLFSWQDTESTTLLHFVRPITYIATFFINYFILVPRYLTQRRLIWYFFGFNIILAIADFSLITFIHMSGGPTHLNIERPNLPDNLLNQLPPPPSGNMTSILHFITRDLVFHFLTVGLSVAFRLYVKWAEIEAKNKAIEAERKEIELKNLKNQLNPHFLFNTLNNIYSLVVIDTQKTQSAIHQLSQLLRYMLYENKEELVPLENEIKFINNYIDLMKLRLSSNIKLNIDIDECNCSGLKIAPFMFISLIENAFKHGICNDKHAFICISIHLTGNVVECSVENSYCPKAKSDKSGSGIGISNLKKQLAIIYPNRHKFEQFCNADKHSSILKITL